MCGILTEGTVRTGLEVTWKRHNGWFSLAVCHGGRGAVEEVEILD